VNGLPPIPQSRGFNHLPYRMMLPQRRAIAGRRRCASMTREGHSAARVSGGCFVMGSCGAAAHLALAGKTAVAESILPSYRACWKLRAPISG